MKPLIEIAGRHIGPGYPVFIIAEMSANHSQNFGQAVKLIRAAREAGADAVKLQTYTPDTLTIRSDRPCFRIRGGTLWDGRTLYDLYGEAYMPWEWQPKLKKIADRCGLIFFSTAFDPTSVEFLEKMNVPVHKIASFEIVDIPLIQAAARTGKPLILSTGMATLAEIREAVAAARKAGARQIALLKCTSAYPAPPEEMNLCAVERLGKIFGVPAGLSDHTLGTTVSVAAVALGACMIERHFTLSRNLSSADSSFSLEPVEFRGMVDAIRMTESALGKPVFGTGKGEEKSRTFRRSLFAVTDVKKGEVFTRLNVRSIRPGVGLAPKWYKKILGRKASKSITLGTPLSWDLVQ